jgi:hypothetical protein
MCPAITMAVAPSHTRVNRPSHAVLSPTIHRQVHRAAATHIKLQPRLLAKAMQTLEQRPSRGNSLRNEGPLDCSPRPTRIRQLRRSGRIPSTVRLKRGKQHVLLPARMTTVTSQAADRPRRHPLDCSGTSGGQSRWHSDRRPPARWELGLCRRCRQCSALCRI